MDIDELLARLDRDPDKNDGADHLVRMARLNNGDAAMVIRAMMSVTFSQMIAARRKITDPTVMDVFREVD